MIHLLIKVAAVYLRLKMPPLFLLVGAVLTVCSDAGVITSVTESLQDKTSNNIETILAYQWAKVYLQPFSL